MLLPAYVSSGMRVNLLEQRPLRRAPAQALRFPIWRLLLALGLLRFLPPISTRYALNVGRLQPRLSISLILAACRLPLGFSG